MKNTTIPIAYTGAMRLNEPPCLVCVGGVEEAPTFMFIFDGIGGMRDIPGAGCLDLTVS